MNSELLAACLSVPLPEHILKQKWAGDLEGAIHSIDRMLTMEQLPAMLCQRLLVEKERLRRLPTQYPWNRTEAIQEMQRLVPDFTEAELDALEAEGRLDYLYLHGEKRYFVRFHRTLIKETAMQHRMGQRVNGRSDWLDPMVQTIREQGCLRRRITLETSVYVDKDSFEPGEYRVWLPIAAQSAQQRNIQLLSGAPDSISPETAPARCAHWHRTLTQWQPFTLRYSYESCIRYADPLHQPAPEAPLYPDALPVEEADLAEDGTYLRFTPYLRSLAAELTAGTASPVEKAWRFYCFITQRVQYSFMRDYFQIDHLGEYCAVNLRGDCGLQALLFILLCRIAGIPARWQSGLSAEPSYTGSHDWAQFHLPGWGWLFADPSYGGSAWRNGSPDRHAFYFGNLDPMRMVANRVFQAPLDPMMNALRVDPFDNQSGEMERIGTPLPFTGRQLDGDATLLAWEDLPNP